MIFYKPARGSGLYFLPAVLFAYDGLIILGSVLVNSYVLSSLLKILLVLLNLYLVYYIIMGFSLKYGLDDENMYIFRFLKNIKISLNSIEGYKIENGRINGVRLSGFGTSSFALGKSVVKSIGTTSMFVTNSSNVLYVKCSDVNYAVSPKEFDLFLSHLKDKGISNIEWELRMNKDISLHKDKRFMLPFIFVSIVISILTLNPFILYLRNKLPAVMPLNFDSSFLAVEFGSGKQFAFSQMIYGVLNMAVLFCMYYAAHFYAKYDRKSAYKFIYASLIIALAFLLIQFKILSTFK